MAPQTLPASKACTGSVGDEGCTCTPMAQCNSASLACVKGKCVAASCTTGESGCACYPNATCNSTLQCVSGTCQASGGVAGAGGTGSAGASGAGSAGASASGGTSGPGAGGDGAGATAGMAGVSGSGASGASGTGGGSAGAGATSGASGTSGSGGSGGGDNLITNGDISQGSAHWDIQIAGIATTNFTTNGGQLCLTVPAASSGTIGWPASGETAMNLSGSYKLSFQASSTAPITFSDKIGLAMSPWTEDFSHPQSVSTSLMTFTDTNTINDSFAGLVFIISTTTDPATVCVDNVVIVPG